MNGTTQTGVMESSPPEQPMSGAPQGGMGQAKAKASQKTRELKENARHKAGQMKARGSDAARRLQNQGKAYAETRKFEMADKISGCGSAVRRAAEKLRDEEDPNIARYAEMAADRIDQAGDYLRARDVRGMVRDAENIARRRPEILFAGMFVAGLALARFLKASQQEEYAAEEDYWVENEEPMGSPSMAAGPASTEVPATIASGPVTSPAYPPPQPEGMNS